MWHHSLQLMNSFNKTEAAVFSCRLCLLRAFPFISLIKHGIHVHLFTKLQLGTIDTPSIQHTDLNYSYKAVTCFEEKKHVLSFLLFKNARNVGC